jgi:5-methylcytosine-specific restriction endonuclease McrA
MTTNSSLSLDHISDNDLLERVRRAVEDERHATANLIALLAEVDARRLYLAEGFSSLFTYCTQALHLSEHAAYNRIESARAARRFPAILDLIDAGAVTLTTIRLLAPHLTAENSRELLERARHKSKREVELLIATVDPKPDAPTVVRKLSALRLPKPPAMLALQDEAVTTSGSVAHTRAHATAPLRTAEVKPLAPERYKIQVTVSRETYAKLRRAQDLLRHVVPNGDAAAIVERALDLLVAELERTKLCVTNRPRSARSAASTSRHIPANVKRMVWQRDAGRCAFTGAQGRCSETGFLEYHHIVPFASGGEMSVSNVELRCRNHNQYEADLWFGYAKGSEARERRALFGE